LDANIAIVFHRVFLVMQGIYFWTTSATIRHQLDIIMIMDMLSYALVTVLHVLT